MSDAEYRLQEEVQFWLRLSSDQLEASQRLPRTRVLLALTDAIRRLVELRQSSLH